MMERLKAIPWMTIFMWMMFLAWAAVAFAQQSAAYAFGGLVWGFIAGEVFGRMSERRLDIMTLNHIKMCKSWRDKHNRLQTICRDAPDAFAEWSVGEKRRWMARTSRDLRGQCKAALERELKEMKEAAAVTANALQDD
jgi:hypothetical protein